jgi:hypothetical protein
MKRFIILISAMVFPFLFGGVINACYVEGYVYCDTNQNGFIDEGDDPLVGVIVQAADLNGWSGQATTDSSGYYTIHDPYFPYTLTMNLDETTLPGDAIFVDPPQNEVILNPTPDVDVYYQDWLVDSATCRGEGKCWLTGGGVKFESITGTDMAQKGPKDSLGGNVYPGCNEDSGDGGQWNHIAHILKLHFQGWTIHVETCGNVADHEPGSDSPVTPYNYIEFSGTGTLKGIHGNKVDYGTVNFFARAEDRNEPGSKEANAGAYIDKYFLYVFDSEGTKLLLIDGDGIPATVDPVTITGGNLQIHISSCDDPPE